MVTGIMRRISGAHGTCTFAFADGVGRRASSSGVMPGWSAGLSRKYRPHAKAHNMLTQPTTMNDPRHEMAAISDATSHGVIEFPSRENACVKPCAKPRRSFDTQYDMARVAVGKVAPSPNPRMPRATHSALRPCNRPVPVVTH